MCLANSSQGLTPHTPKEGFVAFFFMPGHSSQKRGHAQPALQTVIRPPRVCYISSQALLMTDYSTAIFGLIAFTGVVSAAVVYILAQPSDLPVVKKAKAAQS